MDVLAETSRSEALWAPRRQLSLEKARERSRLVVWLRRIFIAGAAISIGVLMGHLAANAIQNSGRNIQKLSGNEVVTMINPRFSGRDDMGEPYVIMAKEAKRQTGNDDVVWLSEPTISDENGGLISAPQGLYNQKEQTLELFGRVVAADPGGYVFNSNRALIHVAEGRIEGLEPLKGSGPIGEVESTSYEILDEGDRIVLSGNVKMTLYPNKTPATPSEETDENED